MPMIRRVTRAAACLAVLLVLTPLTAEAAGDTAVAKALERHFQESCKADAPWRRRHRRPGRRDALP